MRRQAGTGRKFTVSGPGADVKKACESERVGLSYGLTLASQYQRALKAASEPYDGCWYVRNEDGDIEGRVELLSDGTIRSVMTAFV
jgi:hypothetical protein